MEKKAVKADDSPRGSPPKTASLEDSIPEVIKEADLDSVLRSDSNKLAHPTADRVKAPKRRPPSSLFVKEAVRSFTTCYVMKNFYS